MNDKILIESELDDYLYLFEDFDQINLIGLNESYILLNEELLLEDLEDKIVKADEMVEKYITSYSRVTEQYEKKVKLDWAIQESFRYIEVGIRIIQVITGLTLISKKADKVYSVGSSVYRTGQNTKRTVENKINKDKPNKSMKTSRLNRFLVIVVLQIVKVVSKICSNMAASKRQDDLNRLITTKNKLITISKIEGLEDIERQKVNESIKKIDVVMAEYKNKYASKV